MMSEEGRTRLGGLNAKTVFLAYVTLKKDKK